MPKFTVYLQQYVEEIATMTIEAETADEACDLALLRAPEAEWQDGSDSYKPAVTDVEEIAP